MKRFGWLRKLRKPIVTKLYYFNETEISHADWKKVGSYFDKAFGYIDKAFEEISKIKPPH